MSDIEITNENVTTSPNASHVEERLVEVSGQHVIMLEDCVQIMLGDNLSQVEKRISYEDFATIVGAVVNRRNNDSMEGFQLPANCFYFAKNAAVMNISCYYAESVRQIQYGTSKFELKMPNTIISHQLTKASVGSWRHNGAHFLVTDAKPSTFGKQFPWDVDPSKRLFLFPFPNTYSEGHMCYGGNSMPSVFTDNNLSGLNWYYQFLFESPFNNDLGLRGVSGEESITSWLNKLVKVAKENKTFPYENLRGYTRVA
jgi:hypothetical protein